MDPYNWPHPSFKTDFLEGIYGQGVTEPWISQAVAALLAATGQRTVLEIGSFLGYTTAWMADTLSRMGGGDLHVVEIDQARADETERRVAMVEPEHVNLHIHVQNSHDYLRETTETFGFAWVDGNHHFAHVGRELDLLRPHMAPGGLICMHDVNGPLGLDEVCRQAGGYPLYLPKLGPAGGLGIIQT